MTQTHSHSASETPLFSIIVPTYKVQAFLRDCLDSVLEQSFRDYELLVVNDCSPDGCGEIIDEYAEADSRVVAMHLEQNVGLGRARNAGMARAKGTYVLFLDSDDTMLPGSLQAIARRIEESDNPDLVIFDYARTHWNGRVTPNARADVLAEAAQKGVFPLSEQPELLGLLQVAWNKAYRRDFLDQWGFEYPSGYYEDTPWTYPVMIAAETIAVLDRVCIYYRQRRQGSILHSTSRKHFDVFDQYDLVFKFLAENPKFAEYQGVIYERMINHFRVIADSPGRLPNDARAEFQARWNEEERRYRPAGQSAPARTKRQLVPAKHQQKARKTVQWVKRKAKPTKLKRKLRKRLLETYYKTQRMLPVKNDVAVFAAYWNASYSCNPAAIHEKMKELAPGIKAVWVLKNNATSRPPKGVTVVHPGSIGFWKAMARGKYFINNVNFPPSVVKREGQVHLQTHHGTPLKRMGVDLAEYPVGRSGMNLNKLMERVDRWDYSLTSNSFSTAAWDRAYPSFYEPLEYGYPRNDQLVNATAADVAAAREKLGIAEGTKVILYTPTHRDYHDSPKAMLDLEKFAEAIGSEYTLLVRAHYFYKKSLLAFGSSGSARLVDVSTHPSVEELYLASDCLLVDYSSVMFDYANLDRPIVVFANDWEVYRTTRGTYFDITVDSPGLTVRTEEEVTEVFTSGRWNSAESDAARAVFRKRFCEFDDGRAAERVVRKVFLGQDEVPPVLPIGERPVPPRPAALRTAEAAPPRDRETV
ncbi:bifunctional glycosyltransferase family 2 protein/CDP-glycerol:glycerophosphate glycerophosphotransferase [Streptomyces sp. NPDC048717]|uniref:bifunctional glycosyltransferase/CDP-glycerol:glycerophosphate glycerophosphotransferase n=1 Tax=unclassified Streptomyces TaxID=2593676 RepID=UPI003432246A